MSNVFVDKNKIDLLANAISAKSGESLTLTLDEMVEAVDGIDTSGGGGGTPNLQTKSYTVDSAGTETITADVGYDGLSEVEVTVPLADPYFGAEAGFYTENNVRKWRFRGKAVVYNDDGYLEGYIGQDAYYGSWEVRNVVPSNTTVTPTTSSQTIGGANYMMEGAVTVSAMPSGTAGTPTATKGAVSNHSVSVTPSVTNTTGYITGSTKTGTAVTVSASELASGSKYITSNGTDIDVVGYSTVDVDVPPSSSLFVLVSGTGDANNCYVSYDNTKYYGSWNSIEVRSLSSVTIHYSGTLYYNGEPYESSGTYKNTDITIANNTTIELHYGDAQRTVDIWEEITPYDTETFTTNGTYNVYTDKEITVNVSGGGSSKNVQVLQSTSRTNASSLTKVLGDLTVSKTGTYDIYWSGGRSNTSTSYTWGTRLYIDGTGYDTENTTWTNNCQSNHLSNVSLTANQKLSVYARGRTGSYYTFAPMLVIIEA